MVLVTDVVVYLRYDIAETDTVYVAKAKPGGVMVLSYRPKPALGETFM